MGEPREEQEIFSFEAARKKWNRKLDLSKDTREKRAKRLAKTIDHRALRTTGRSKQFNFRCREGLKEKVQEAANKTGLSLAEWMEVTLMAALEKPTRKRKGKKEGA